MIPLSSEDITEHLTLECATFSAGDNNTYPSSMDYSASSFFPNYLHQQGNSCVAQNTAYYAFTFAANRLHNVSAKNADGTNNNDNVYSPMWLYESITENDEGVYASSAYEFLKAHGALSVNEYAQANSFDTVSDNLLINALETRVDEWYTTEINTQDNPIINSNSSELLKIKQKLSQGYLMQVNMWNTLRVGHTTDGEVIILDTACKVNSPTAHSMTIIGYDDNIQYDYNNDGNISNYEKGALKMADSRILVAGENSTYGNNAGYYWLAYDAINAVSQIPGSENVSPSADKVRMPAFTAKLPSVATIHDNIIMYMDVQDYDVEYACKLNVTMNDKRALQIALSRINGNQLETINFPYAMSNTSQNIQPVTMNMFFDYASLCQQENLTDYITNAYTWQISSKNPSSIIVNNAFLMDNKRNIITAYTCTTSGNYTTGTCAVNLQLGDVDYDGQITSSDMRIVLRYASGTILLSNLQMFLADVNDDGTVDMQDARILLQQTSATMSNAEKRETMQELYALATLNTTAQKSIAEVYTCMQTLNQAA